ncbi:hypothetical protein J6I92_07200 [Pseudidiomarina sp. 1APR75-15]|uniref:Alpha-2-macroglobulin bait region domain-containing protein n=1 Tax=Pseudidiomarina terrestris TaxID=2820060 RepID=A0ABT8MI82_9GAMM|nr:hypothetical protein [Pseudidiomarina sp. 1APR75-15]MDN7129654.1 hypothetical protein [Pseudidiomarina sp. 1APR75-15]
MRMLGRLLLLLLGLALLAALWYAAQLSLQSLQKIDVQPWEDDYEQSTVYILQPGETFEFDVPNEATQLRILHTPVGVVADDEQATLQFTARPNASLSESYNVMLYGEEAPVGEQLPGRFFDSPQDTLAGITQLHVVSFAQRQSLNEFALTLTESSRPIAIRVAVLVQYDEASVSRMWQRLNEEQKARFFEDHIYPVELVPERERAARLMQRWQPIGPADASSERINSRILFVNEQAEVFENDEDQITDELAVIGPERWFTIDTRVQTNLQEFACESLSGAASTELQLRSVTEAGESVVTPVRLDAESPRAQLPAQPGLYQLSARARCELVFYDANGEMVSADYNYLRASVVQPDSSLTFALVPDARQAQPLRLDARRLTRRGAAPAQDLSLQWRIVDAAGEELLSGQLQPQLEPNPYQVSVDSSLVSTVHEKSSQYIVAPAHSAELRVSLSHAPATMAGQVLINLYTRPADLAYRVEPGNEDEPQQQSIPKWFLAYPMLNNTELPVVTQLISWQMPLPEPAATAEAGVEEQWYTLTSVNEAPYFELFLAAGEPGQQLEVTADSAHLVYAPVAGDGSRYVVSAPGHAQKVRPQLVYQKATDAPVPVEIKLNGQLVAKDWLNARSGRLFLPALAQSDYTLTLTAPTAVQWYSNYQPVSAQPHYRVRNGYKLTQPLTFVVDKTAEEEWLTFNYFPAIAAPHQLTLTLEKQEQVGVYADYTVAKRSFPLAAAERSPSVVLLNQNQAPVWQPIRLPFLLGRDLAEGRYRVTVSTSAPNSGYVQAGYSAAVPLYQIEIYTEDGNALF